MSLRQQQGKDVPAPGDNQVMLRYILLLDANYELKIVLCQHPRDCTFANPRAESIFCVNVPKGPSTFKSKYYFKTVNPEKFPGLTTVVPDIHRPALRGRSTLWSKDAHFAVA